MSTETRYEKFRRGWEGTFAGDVQPGRNLRWSEFKSLEEINNRYRHRPATRMLESYALLYGQAFERQRKKLR